MKPVRPAPFLRFSGIAFLAFSALALPLMGQARIESNEANKGNLAGKNEADTWIFEVTEDNSDLHFELLTEAGQLQVTVFPFGQRKPIRIIPVGRKGYVSGASVVGQKIEATQVANFKLPAGKYQIQVKPSRDHPGSYSLRIIEPSLGEKASDGSPVAPEPTPPPASLPGGPGINELVERIAELEKRVSALENAGQGRSGK